MKCPSTADMGIDEVGIYCWYGIDEVSTADLGIDDISTADMDIDEVTI